MATAGWVGGTDGGKVVEAIAPAAWVGSRDLEIGNVGNQEGSSVKGGIVCFYSREGQGNDGLRWEGMLLGKCFCIVKTRYEPFWTEYRAFIAEVEDVLVGSI